MVDLNCNGFTARGSDDNQATRMEQQQIDSNNGNKSVEEITNRLDQMNVDTQLGEGNNLYGNFQNLQQQQQQHNMVGLRNCNHRLGSADSQDRMSIDDENMQPLEETMQQQQQQTACMATKRSESNILIITNVDPIVFSDSLVKAKFESLFTAYDEQVLFRYLKSFRRVRLDFTTSKRADQARLNLNNYKLGSSAFKCYLAQMIRPNTTRNDAGPDFGDERQQACFNTNQTYDQSDEQQQQQTNNFYLSIPKPSKQFLISPPVSPPEGWKPHDEGSPCIDVQLISAIANLLPGQVHEIHPGNESQPGIFVEVCEDSQDYDTSGGGGGGGGKRIPKTASPIAAARAAISQAMRTS